ncbi:MAG: ATP-binding cassette domain-containing protein [Myxococcales bacterium]|nr:ATP-binding cassette domain-containing protein [Myxococcales bacterium]
MITATDLSMHFGGQTLFENAHLQLNASERYGIVGANGAGKSTLLRILSGEQSASGGEVVRAKAARIGVLDQDHFRYDDVPILDVVMMGNAELWEALQEREKLFEDADAFDDDRFVELEDIVARFDGYGLEARAARVLAGLGVPTQVHRQPLSSLSGGFKLRVLMAKVLAGQPDLLFLDEPTNHLDIVAIRWLEEFLDRFTGCAVVVSHDLAFLDAACTHILDVDYQRVTAYKGNYSAFLRLKDSEIERKESEIAKRRKEIDDHKAFIARFQAKATKARQANSRQKRMEKIVIEELPASSRRHPAFRFEARRPSGREVLKVSGVSKAFGDNIVLLDVSFLVERGDKVAVIGPNGIGKSTLLKIALDRVGADEGEVIWGHETDVGYFPQDHMEALGDREQSVSSCMWDACPDEGLGAVIARLASVLFTREDTDKAVENLSGGEGARLLFARLAAAKPTVLVLDEPTNHLDLEGIEALANALAAYDGTLIFVSHDRWFVDRLATRIIAISEDGVEDYRGTYSEFVDRHTTDHLDRDAVVAASRSEQRKRKKKGGRGARSANR